MPLVTGPLAFESLSERIFPLTEPDRVHVEGKAFDLDVLSFPQGASRKIAFDAPAAGYITGNVVLDVYWYASAGSTTGSVTWSAALAAVTPGDASNMETKALASSVSVTTAVNANFKGLQKSTLTITSTDGLAAGDWLTIVLTRSTTDTLSSNAYVVGINQTYDSTQGSLPPFTLATIFYLNSSTGNDANDGLTPGTAWLTVARAWAERQKYSDIVASFRNLCTGTGFVFPTVGSSVCGTNGLWSLEGDPATKTVALTGTFTGNISAVAPLGTIPTSPGLGVDTHKFKFVRVTSGAMIGCEFQIHATTDTSITPMSVLPWTAASLSNGDTFEIFTPNCTLNFPNTLGAPAFGPTDWVGGLPSRILASNPPQHVIRGFRITGTPRVINSVVCFNQIHAQAAITFYRAYVSLGGIANGFPIGVGPNSQSWYLWGPGLYTQSTVSLDVDTYVMGIIGTASVFTVGATAFSTYVSAGHRIDAATNVRAGEFYASLGDANMRHGATVNVFDGAFYKQSVSLVFAMAAGDAMHAQRGGQVTFGTPASVQGGTTAVGGYGSRVSGPSRIVWAGLPTLTGVAGDLKTDNTAGAANATLAAAGQAQLDAVNGGVIARVA